MRTVFGPALVDQAHALNTPVSPGKPCAHVIEKSSVNLGR